MPNLKATAHHEAGHALITLWHDRSFKRVTIKPGTDYLGMTFGTKTRLKLDEVRHSDPGNFRKWGEMMAKILFAGGIAERLYTGKRNRFGSARDMENAWSIAELVENWMPDANGVNRAAIKWFEWQEAVTENLVAVEWPRIRLGAEALLEHQTLTAAEFREAIQPGVHSSSYSTQ